VTRLLLALHLVLLSASLGAQRVNDSLETEVKATFLFQFSRYVDWPPPSGGRGNNAQFKVCTLAGSTFNEAVDRAVQGERAADRPMIRVTPANLSEARECQILYVSVAERAKGQPLVESLKNAAMLTVSDAPDFFQWGGQIKLLRDESRVRFDVNLPAAREAGITLRSQLLRVARKVIRQPVDRP
jgi:hypothetical protein